MGDSLTSVMVGGSPDPTTGVTPEAHIKVSDKTVKAKPAPKPAPEPTPAPAEKPAPSADKTVTAMRDLGAAQQDYATRMPERPNPPQLPERPKTFNDDVQLWGSLAIAFAALASTRTRTPMTTALDAAAAAMNGMREGNKERADQAYKEWQENTKIAFQMADYEQRAYEDALHDREHMDQIHFQALTRAMDDPPMWNAYYDTLQRTGSEEEARKAAAGLWDERKKQADRLKAQEKPIIEGGIMQERWAELKKDPAYIAAITPGPTYNYNKAKEMEGDVLSGASYGRNMAKKPLPDDMIAKQREDVMAGRQAYPTQKMIDIYEGSRQLAEDVDAHREEFKAKTGQDFDPELSQQFVKDKASITGSGKQAQEIRSFTVLTHHLAFFAALEQELKEKGVTNNDSPLANGIVISVAKQFGMPEITNLAMAKDIVGKELVKAIVGSGAGGELERLEAAKQLDTQWNTPDQIDGLLSVGRGLALGQLEGRVSQFRRYIDMGWLKESDIVPEQTLAELSATGHKFSVKDPNKLVAPVLGSQAGSSDTPPVPKVGEVKDGYVYKGGDPSQPSSWQKQ